MSGPFLTLLRSPILTDYYIINDVLYYIIDAHEAQEGQLVSRTFNSHCA